ncbi:MAG: glycosyltransferase family 4 protein [Piscirickettsiaceae bacterium]|nr:glycosyltransferase family 4 protein [Piscirickettsiaceae bacterium]
MKIAFITSSTPFGYGESFVITEANALIKQDITMILIPTFLRTKMSQNVELDPSIKIVAKSIFCWEIIKTFVLAILNQPKVMFNIFKLLWTKNSLTFIKNIIVLPKAIWVGQLVIKEGVEHIHAHWASTPSTVAMLASIYSGVPWSFTAHRGDIVANNLLAKKIKNALFSRFISESGISLAKQICQTQLEKLRLLHMGVNLPDDVKCKALQKDKVTVLCPANFIPVKGHSYLIEAIFLLNKELNVELSLAGKGPLMEKLKHQVDVLGLSTSVKFLGQLPHQALLGMYEKNEIDVVVLPSLDLGGGLHEGIPVSLMEAMSYAVPVISTATGGIPELLNNGAGIIVPPFNAKALANAINYLVSEKTIYSEVGLKGRQKIDISFNQKKITSSLKSWFIKLNTVKGTE